MKEILFVVLSIGLCAAPAAGSILFSDLGTGSNVYDPLHGYGISGSTSIVGSSFTEASLFTVGGTGSQNVTQIDLAVLQDSGGTFRASIWTDVSGKPGSQVAGALWSPLTATPAGSCCALVTISGISGVKLTGGQKYFMILGPVSVTDDSDNMWADNTRSITGDRQYSTDGGITWNDVGSVFALPAYDILSIAATPEPGSLFLMGAGLIGIGIALRRKL